MTQLGEIIDVSFDGLFERSTIRFKGTKQYEVLIRFIFVYFFFLSNVSNESNMADAVGKLSVSVGKISVIRFRDRELVMIQL